VALLSIERAKKGHYVAVFSRKSAKKGHSFFQNDRKLLQLETQQMEVWKQADQDSNKTATTPKWNEKNTNSLAFCH